MLDINFIRENPDQIKKAIADKNIDLDLDKLLAVDKKRRGITPKIDALRFERKKISSDVGSGLRLEPENSRTKGSSLRLEPTEEIGKKEEGIRGKEEEKRKKDVEKVKEIKKELGILEEEYAEIKIAYDSLMAKVPTVPSFDTPVGKNEESNKEIYVKGKIPKFDFKPKNHIEIGKDLDILDLERGVKVGGYRGYYVKGDGVLLMMGLMNFALSKMVEKGYQLLMPPTLVKGFSLFGSGYFKGTEYDQNIDEIYQIASSDKEVDGKTSKEKKFLVGTAEPSLLAYYANEILDEKSLPMRICGFSQCYRSEIGSYGKDTKGIYRVHEFMKVEQVVLAEADVEKTNKLQEEMLGISEELHQELGLPYRKLQICTGDMSPGKYRAFDLEAWMPGLNRFGETGSASNFLDWQSRRLNVKYKTCPEQGRGAKDGEKKFVYMLNNTALATPRTFIAILENYQQKDGSVRVPKVLQEYVGKKVVTAK